MIERARHSLDVDPLAPVTADAGGPMGLRFDDPDNLMLWWGMGALTPWQTVVQTTNEMTKYDLWKTELFSDFRPFEPLVKAAPPDTVRALARQLGWRIVLRIEDLDTPRVKPETIDATIRTLQWLGLDWDQGPIIQSKELEHHADAMRSLAARGLVYPSPESRAEVEDAAAGLALSAPQAGAHDAVFPAALKKLLEP